jgi:ubiquitin-conjugating enzyme E2 Q
VAREVSGFSDDIVASITEAPAPASANNLVADEIPNNEDEDDDDEYEYEDDDDAAFSGFLVDNPAIAAAASVVTDRATTEPAKIEEEALPVKTSKWRQPTKEAVDMSLRAETEKSGGKRRLAQDLYRIMNQETKDRGFSLQPSSEDSMDKWTIKLFQFDEDSNLAKDMKVLGLENIEIEMSFPDQYPFEPPFVRVMRPRFKRQTGFVMNGALCMELLTKVR